MDFRFITNSIFIWIIISNDLFSDNNLSRHGIVVSSPPSYDYVDEFNVTQNHKWQQKTILQRKQTKKT